jgi:hypothetical protein
MDALGKRKQLLTRNGLDGHLIAAAALEALDMRFIAASGSVKPESKKALH